ncbi:NAD(P)/FAD-dependent oxidoreductase [Bradyrhizobium sp.]|uniref:FAD-dependent oxidoreductase n=1 Tax=Bradyrhizobium sp. TaxID=376 RepID=UPI00260B9070|nr:NAD(P)/FAD-dependent oxidoreductase [Bradyrhizobium sp.]
MNRYDVLVVGTRCSGAPLCMLLARRGIKVLGIDRAHFPSDTLSTHFMWPRTTSYLAKWGLLDQLAATGCPPIHRVTADYGAVTIRGRPSAVEGTAIMFSPRRTVLDQLLVEAARDAGADMHDAVTFRELLLDGDRVVGAQLQGCNGTTTECRAALVVGADGIWSAVARAASAATDIQYPSLTCGYYAYWSGVPTNGVEFYIRDGRDILVFPTHDGLTCIWAGRSRKDWETYRKNVEHSYHDVIAAAPCLAERLADAERVTPFRGTSKLPNFYRRSFGVGWALVGDAAYHRDPIAGMGIGDAFVGAQCLADALAEGLGRDAETLDTALLGYQEAFRDRTMPIFSYTVKAASLKEQASAMPIYARIAQSEQDTVQFMDVLAGNTPAKNVFNPENIARLLA